MYVLQGILCLSRIAEPKKGIEKIQFNIFTGYIA